MKLYGSTTSPYVRRVRIVALEIGEPLELVDTATETGQAELRARSPVWKVPAAELDGTFVLDSHVLIDELVSRRGAPFRPSAEWSLRDRNCANVIDTTLDSLIQRFYLLKDGVRETVPYLEKQTARAASAFSWLERNLTEEDAEFSPLGLALTTAIGWIRLRDAYPIERHGVLCRGAERLEARPSFAATRPG